MIVDSHVHYWEPPTPDRAWDPAGQIPGAPVSVEALLGEARSAGVDRVVGITLRLMGQDNRYALEGAQRYPDRIAAVFGRVDPRGDDLRSRLGALAANPKFAGVRFALFLPEEMAWLVDGTLDRFLDVAAELGLLVAIFCARPRELGRLAARHPSCTVLADHMAIDHRRLQRESPDDVFAGWGDVLALANVPNVRLKVSNIAELSRGPFPFKDVVPRIRAVYESFGPDRLVWGSNYPPSKERASYAESVRCFAELSFVSDADKAKIMGTNFLGLLHAPKEHEIA